MARLKFLLRWHWEILVYLSILLALILLTIATPVHAQTAKASSTRQQHAPYKEKGETFNIQQTKATLWGSYLDIQRAVNFGPSYTVLVSADAKKITITDPDNNLVCFASAVQPPYGTGFTVTCVAREDRFAPVNSSKLTPKGAHDGTTSADRKPTGK